MCERAYSKQGGAGSECVDATREHAKTKPKGIWAVNEIRAASTDLSYGCSQILTIPYGTDGLWSESHTYEIIRPISTARLHRGSGPSGRVGGKVLATVAWTPRHRCRS